MLSRNITGDDIKILNYLQTYIELKRRGKKVTPVLWVVQESVPFYGVTKELANGWVIRETTGGTATVGNANDISSAIESLTDTTTYGLGSAEDYHGCLTPEKVIQKAESIFEVIHGFSHKNFMVEYYCETREIKEGPVFLTRGACIDYIEKHRDELSDPEPHKIFAKDCKELQQLYETLLGVDWDMTVIVGSEHACWRCRHSDLNGDPNWVGCSRCRHNKPSLFEPKDQEVASDGE